jgi:tetratricopeptide (TPR) repeat protein
MDKTYQEFEIHLKKKSKDNYIAELVDSKGKTKAEKPFVVEMDKLKMREDLQHLEKLAISSEPVKDEFHINFGKHIFNLVFGDGIKAYYDQCLKKDQPLRIRIRIDETAKELNEIPWEFLHDGENFLVTQSETLISRLPLNVEKKKKDKLDQAISMLVVISSPMNLPEHMVLNTEKEQEVILEALDKLHRERKLDIDFVDDASLDTIQDYLSEKNYHILHFTGHGIFDENKDKGFLLLGDSRGRMENVENERMATILQNHKSLRLVVLSSCQSAKASNNTGYPDLSRTLLRKGIPAVLSMQHSILDPSAIDFAGRLYRSLAGGKPVDVALSDARTALYVGEEKNRVDFATPVLFLNDPDSVNVADIKVEEEKFELKKKPFHVGEVTLKEKGFVGRRKELRMIKEGFVSDRKRAFVIHGFGGIGKSVLATRAALKLEDFFGGVKAIKFKPATKPEDILNDLNGFLMLAGIHDLNKYLHEPIPIETKTQVLIQILNQLRFLIIFDNFEDVLSKETEKKISDPDLSKFIQLLLNGVAQNTKFIFTSRYDFDPLDGRLSGDIGKINLPELSFPFMVFLMNNFEELKNLEVAIPEKELEKMKVKPATKREIYEKIGGHPYTLGIFTKHARTTSVDHLLLDLAPVTKEMMEFTLLDMTYDKLSDKAKTLLKRMSVFEEAVPLEALQWIIGDEKDASPDVGEELKSLIGWGLVAKTERWKIVKVGEKEQWVTEDVFVMHQLVKDFASDKLCEDKTEDRKKLKVKAANFYEMLFETSKSLWDLLRARDYYYQAKEYTKAWRIVDFSTLYLDRWGYVELLIKLLNESINTIGGTSKAVALGNLATFSRDTGDCKTAIEKLSEVKDIFEKEGDRGNVAIALHQLGISYRLQGNYKEALKNYEASLKIKEKLGDKSSIAKTLHELGNIHYLHGSYEEALKNYDEELEICQDLRDKSGIARTLHQLGNIHYLQGNFKEAVKNYEEELEIYQDLGDKRGIAITLHQLGMIHQVQGDYPEAVKKYEQSLNMFEELGDKSGIAATLHSVGTIHYEQGDYKEAVKKCEQSLKIKEKLGDKSGIAITLHQLGMIHQVQGDYPEAVKKYEQSLKTKEELGNKSSIAKTLHQLGMIHQDQGNYKEAVKKYEESLKIDEELGDKDGIARSYGQLGRVNEEQTDYKEAMKKYLIAFSIFKELGSPDAKIAGGGLARLREKMGEKEFEKAWKEITGEGSKQ